jgi:hypothetical protein
MFSVRLPKTRGRQKILDAAHLNFVLQQEHGCAYTCVVPPSETEDGWGLFITRHRRGAK